MRLPLRLAATLGTAALLSAACSSVRDLPLQPETREPPTFEGARDGGDAATTPGETLMCPVTTCSAPRATCPSSKFPCDIDLSRDSDNCGACGVRCWDGVGQENWTCVDGRCSFACPASGWADCDGESSNGCEVYIAGSDSNNCGACGNKCPAGLTCSSKGECTNGCDQAKLPDKCGTKCTDLAFDDENCGRCGIECDPTGPGAPPVADGMYYGCLSGTCGKKKCSVPNAADCNGDPSDGCEAMLHTNEHCNGCNDKCPAGKQCGEVTFDVFQCLCEDDRETYCAGFFMPFCRRLDDDPQNCGGCDRVCPGLYAPNFAAECTNGVCGGACNPGHADCDGLADNGCEVDTGVDNRNCGGCGKACLPDQVCAEGQCLVAPCDAGAPGDPTR